ncbi:MAG: 50S ribosomal protein L10 [archaeon]
MNKHRLKDIPKKKIKEIEDLVKLIKESNCFLIASIKSLPGKQFQIIKNKIKDHAKVKVVKKSAILRAIDSIDIGAIKNIKEYIKEDVALLFSDIDPFDLSSTLSENTTPAKAKIGQEAPEDIEIEEGPTELTPGPVISELGSLGIQIAIEDGKINIKKAKIIVKKGEKINTSAASIMAKLDIKPFHVGFEPLVAYDNKEKKVYVGIKIDKESALEEIKNTYAKALAFAVEIVYPSKDTISFLIQKAGMHERALEKLSEVDKKEDIKEESKQENEAEEKAAEENTQENKPEEN